VSGYSADVQVIFHSRFLFAYDSLERAILKAEFGKPYVSGMKFVNGYCGAPIGVTVNGGAGLLDGNEHVQVNI
jgi:hypothetical protein